MPNKYKPIKLAKDAVSTRSVYGQGVPAIAPPRRLGMPPKSPFRSGTTGDRSSSFDVTASQIMQQTMTDEDEEYYREIEDDKPHDILRTYINEILLQEKYNNNKQDEQKKYNKQKNEGPEKEEDPEEDVEEASVVANISGYTLPLGATNKSKDDEPSWKAYARAFADAKPMVP